MSIAGAISSRIRSGTNIAPQGQTLQVISETPKNFTVSTQLSTPSNVPNWITVNGAVVYEWYHRTAKLRSSRWELVRPAGVGLYQGVDPRHA